MRSIRIVYTAIEIFTLAMTLVFVMVVLSLLRSHTRQEFEKSHLADLAGVDVTIDGFVRTSLANFQSHLRLKNREDALGLLTNFSDIYVVSNEVLVKRIIKKEDNSQIFIGYDASKSSLGSFVKSISSASASYSPVYLAAENERLSFYVAARISADEVTVGRIGLELLRDDLSKIAQNLGSTIIIASHDGFVLSSSTNSFALGVLPSVEQTELSVDGKSYLLSRRTSTIFDNEIVILTPLSRVYGVLDEVNRYYAYFVIFMVIVVALKIALQTVMLIRPLGNFGSMLEGWDLEQAQSEVPDRFLHYKEIAVLHRLFLRKGRQISGAVAELKDKQRQLDRTRLYLKSILDSMPSVLISVDPRGTVRSWNKAAEKWQGVDAEHAIGSSLQEIAPVLGPSLPECLQALHLRKERELGTLKLEQSLRVMRVSAFPLIQDGIEEIAIRLDDITELERTEQQLRQVQKMEAIGTMVGGIAHDFNNVLSGVVGSHSLMKCIIEESKYPVDPAITELLDTMDRAGQRATDMVRQLLTLSSRQELQYSPVNLSNTVRAVVKFCSVSFDKRVELRTQYPKGPATVQGDPVQLEQLTLNLCINAMHSMTIMRQDGEIQGGVLSLFLGEVRADESFLSTHPEATRDTQYWCLSVKDTGVGMTSATIARVFDPFFTTKPGGKGTGLGLAMVYSIAHKHSGFVSLHSELGVGSKFSVYLPAFQRPNHSIPPMKSMEPGHGEGTVLVVDDEESVRKVAQRMLERCGYRVLQAEDGLRGCEEFEANWRNISVVLLDVNMPKLSGLEALKRMLEIDPGVRVIVATGFVRDEKADSLLEMGAKKYLQKPYSFNELVSAVQDVLVSFPRVDG